MREPTAAAPARPPPRGARAHAVDAADVRRVIIPNIDTAVSSLLSVAALVTAADRSDPSTVLTMIASPSFAVGTADERHDSLQISNAGSSVPLCAFLLVSADDNSDRSTAPAL